MRTFQAIMNDLPEQERRTIEQHYGSLSKSRNKVQQELRVLKEQQGPKRDLKFSSNLAVTEYAKISTGTAPVEVFELLFRSQLPKLRALVSPLLKEAAKALKGRNLLERRYEHVRDPDTGKFTKEIATDEKGNKKFLPSSLQQMQEYYSAMLEDPEVNSALNLLRHAMIKVDQSNPGLRDNPYWNQELSQMAKASEDKSTNDVQESNLDTPRMVR